METTAKKSWMENITVEQFVDYVTNHNLLNHKLCVQYHREDDDAFYGTDKVIRCLEETRENGEKFLII